MHDPIVCLISSYREGELIQGAIRSVLPLNCPILVFEGPTSVQRPGGPKTEVGNFSDRLCGWKHGEWIDEAAKRNEMLEHARSEMRHNPFWLLTVDADEILVWAEYLPDWLNVLRPGYPASNENIVPMKLTMPGTDDETINGPVTWIQPSRLIHSSIIDHYQIGLLVAETPDGKQASYTAYRSAMPPCFGEPHIHHRYYLRRGDRAKMRGTDLERKERARKSLE